MIKIKLKVLLACLISVLTACSSTERHIPKKPFYIIDKGYNTAVSSSYCYQDATGHISAFTDENDKYSVGDSIN
ncbi:MAG: hypothetical protein ACI9AT_000429 [Ulvibacter sp.]|jgi:hypothetical protein